MHTFSQCKFAYVLVYIVYKYWYRDKYYQQNHLSRRPLELEFLLLGDVLNALVLWNALFLRLRRRGRIESAISLSHGSGSDQEGARRSCLQMALSHYTLFCEYLDERASR